MTGRDDPNPAAVLRFTPAQVEFYGRALDLLTAARIPHLVGGAYALWIYTGLQRHTKDLDVFVRHGDVATVLDAFAQAGYRCEVAFPHWLAKVHHRDDLLDLIHSSGNGLCVVDSSWFGHATAGELLGRRVQVCAAEDIIWSKAFIMERERYDGADILHLLHARAGSLDWTHLRRRFGPHWRVLLSHLVLFGFVYPDRRDAIPAGLVDELCALLRDDGAPPQNLCRGTLISRAQYLVDVERWGYRDARLLPTGTMSPAEIATWTAPIADADRPH